MTLDAEPAASGGPLPGFARRSRSSVPTAPYETAGLSSASPKGRRGGRRRRLGTPPEPAGAATGPRRAENEDEDDDEDEAPPRR